MQSRLLCLVVALSVATNAAVAVPRADAPAHRLKQVHRAQATVKSTTMAHEGCLTELRKFTGVSDRTVGLPTAQGANRARELLADNQAGYTDAGGRDAVINPSDEESGRTICKDTANWMFTGIFNGWDRTANGNTGAVRVTPVDTYIRQGTATAAMLAPNSWADAILFHGVFPPQGRVCYVNFIDSSSTLSHQFVIEAPALNHIRHLQSFVRCYTARDWIGSHNDFADFVSYRTQQDCDPLAAKARHGGGQLLDTTQGAGAQWLADMQTLVTAFHTHAPGANTNLFNAISAAYNSLFGVDVGTSIAGYHITGGFLKFSCIPRSTTRCASNSRALRTAVNRWNARVKNHMATLNGGHTAELYNNPPAQLNAWLTSRTYAQGKALVAGAWNAVVNDADARAARYDAFVNGIQRTWCPHTGLFAKGGEYRVTLRANNGFLGLTNGNTLANVAATRVGTLFKYSSALIHGTTENFDIRCVGGGTTPTFGNAFQAQCDSWEVMRNGANAWVAIEVVANTSPAARWLLQVCMTSAHEVRSARFFPSGKLW